MLPDDLPTSPVRPPDGSRTGAIGGWNVPSAVEIQALLPQYEVIEVLGLGGMGAVYKARQKSLRRLVAIKILPPGIVDNELKFRERFQHEAETMAKLSHPGIVSVYDFGEAGEGLLYIVMEFIDGADVARRIASEGALPVEDAVHIIGVVCDALVYAHRQGVIHRDIKPANVLIDGEVRIKVADFGLAKIAGHSMQSGLTRTNVAMGTQEFAAPEQLMPGAVVDHRADVYSLGVTLYQMLTGEVPRVMFKLPSRCRPELGTRFDALICKALETDPADRFQTVDEFKRALESGVSQGVKAKAVVPVGGAGEHRSARVIFASATAALLTVGLAGWFIFGHKHGHASIPKSGHYSTTSTSSPGNEMTAGARVIKLWDTESKVPKETAVRWENGAVVLGDSHDKGQLFYSQPRSRDAIIRAEIRANPDAGNAQLRLRYNWTEGPGDFYRLELKDGVVDLSVSEHGKGREIKTWPLPRAYGPDDWARLELRAVGDELTASLDGSVLGTVHDASLSQPGSVVIAANRNGYFRNIEYVPLDTASAAASALSQSEPNAMKLWDAPETLSKKEGVSWENNSVKLDNAMLVSPDPLFFNASLRALVKMNPDSRAPGISLRGMRDANGDRRYSLSLEPIRRVIQLQLFSDTGRTVLREWPYLRDYGKEDWARLELRVVGDELTASIDGKALGTLHDSMLAQAGRAQIYAKQAGFFRDIILVPLDTPASVAAKTEPIEPSAIRLWDGLDKIPNQTGARWEKDAVRLDHSALVYPGLRVRDAAVRVEMLMNPDRSSPQIAIRHREPKKGEVSCYAVAAHAKDGTIKLQSVTTDSWTVLKEWPLPRSYGPDEWLKLELRAVGDEVSVFAGDKLLGTVHDTSQPEGGSVMLWAEAAGYFRNIVFVPLDKPGVAQPADRVIDLLSLVDVKRDAVGGEWEMMPDKALVLTRGDRLMRLEFPYSPPASGYDFEIEFTITDGDSGDVSQILPVPGSYIQWRMLTPMAFGPDLDGMKASDPKRADAVNRQALRLTAGQRYRSLVEVRPNFARALLDGMEVARFSGDFKRLSEKGQFKLRDITHPGVSGYNTGVIFHKAEVREVRGVSTPDKPAAQPAARVVDLIPLVDVKRDAIESVWSVTPEGALRSERVRDKSAGRLEFPYAPPAEYDFEIEFTVEEGASGHVRQILAVPGHWLEWSLLPPPAFGPEFDGLANSAKGRTEGVGKFFRLRPGDRHRSVVEVRRNSLRALVDGKEIAHYSGDFKRLAERFEFFKLRDTTHIGVGIFDGIALLIHKATVREVSGADASSAAKEEDFRPLFDGKSLDGWLALNGTSPPDGWRMVDGAMTGMEHSAVMTRDEFGDFELTLDWRVNPQGNGGIFYRVAEEGMVERPMKAVEFNLMDENISAPPVKQCGAAFDVIAPSQKASRPAGEWNTARLLVQGTKVEQWINDKLVCSYNLADASVRDALKRGDIGEAFASVKKGRIALQDWTGEAFYRNMRIRELPREDRH
ncbi:MAG: family 16 glycoside hydrolase [Verrucomicrobiaceae bacterium]